MKMTDEELANIYFNNADTTTPESEDGAAFMGMTEEPFIRTVSAIVNRECRWSFEDEYCTYDTGCGNKWQFETGDIKGTSVEYCPYCGGIIKVAEALHA